MKNNILFTSVGRRDYLIDFFRSAIHGEGKIFVANTHKYVSGMNASDGSFVVPSSCSRDYIQCLLSICLENDIGLVFSLHDWDVPYIVKSRLLFEENDIRIVCASLDFLRICLDKYLTKSFATSLNILYPRTYLSIADALRDIDNQKLAFPLIVKPRAGFGSNGVFTVDDIYHLQHYFNALSIDLRNSPSSPLSIPSVPLIQEFIKGDEYGIDIANDLSGSYLSSCVKRKLSMRSGESDVVQCVHDSKLEDIARLISLSSRHLGLLDVDIMVDEQRNFYLLEMNPRFGGGYPFSYFSGLDLPRYLYAQHRGWPVNRDWVSVKNYPTLCKQIKIKSLEFD